ncbi:MAG: DUF1993 domain-containing protein [Phenylobacterium sp.]|uniref:DUF1993 domain-containing protein n=1 Tax=Phenylobacterium sp. TaxID=1871053 RepID=UPI001228BE2D|nr:DUF1993 domain-containing protein [Phenylobacterium sp.]TAJ74564.1 MAG: DUF1993 domain-containing protein [Phenylobacterium sp.]
MAISLYDVSVASFLQVLGAVQGFLGKGLAHCRETGLDPESIVGARLHDDMLPFRFQIASVAHHSRGALEGAKAGHFAPPGAVGELDYAGLQALVADARAQLQTLTRDEVNSLEGGEVLFRIGSREMPFTVENFLMSFSIPNLHFHATTAYDILRQAGAPLGKRDYMGQLRLKA